MEYLTGILVTFPENVCRVNKHRELAREYRKWIKEDEQKIWNIYKESRGFDEKDYEKYKFLLIQFCSNTVLKELEAILDLTHPSKEYRHMVLDNGVVVIYAIGHVAHILKLAIAFGFGPVLQIKDSYVY